MKEEPHGWMMWMKMIEKPFGKQSFFKRCCDCNENKRNSEKNYYFNKKRNTFNKRCRSCQSSIDKEKVNKFSPDKKLQYRLNKYNITKDQYEMMLKKVDHKCAICYVQFDNSKMNRTHIDHCHTTNVVRGILCVRCNTGLGLFQDSSENLYNATKYLQSSRSEKLLKTPIDSTT